MKYNTKKHNSTRYTVIIAAVMAMLVLGMIIRNAARADRPAWDVCYDMCNQHIEWTGAGYGG